MSEKLYSDDKRFSNKALEWIKFNPKQAEFIYSKHRFLLGSGGKGSGKTVALCIRAILLSVLSPEFGDMSGNNGLMGRLKLKDFLDTTYKELRLWLPKSWIRKYYKKDGILELKNDSTIQFTHFDSIENIVSLNKGWAGIDQMEQIPEDVFMELAYNRTRLKVLERYKYRNNMKIRIIPQFDENGICTSTEPDELNTVLHYQPTFGVCNPRRIRWIHEKFIKNEEVNNKIVSGVQKYNPEYKLIFIPTTENVSNLPIGYIESQKRDKDVRAYQRDVLGLWDAFEGQVFIDFTDDLILLQRLIPKPEWDIYVGIDHGGTGIDTSGATGITHVTFVANEKRKGQYDKIHVFDELYLQSSTIENTVSEIDNVLRRTWQKQKYTYELSGEMIRVNVKGWRIGHDAGRTIQDTDETIMSRYMRFARNIELSMPLLCAGKDIAARIEKISWMCREKLIDVNPHCVHLIDSHKTVEYGTNEKIKSGQDDHACEALASACSALPLWYQDFSKPKKIETLEERELRLMQKNNSIFHPVFGDRYKSINNVYTF